MMMVEANTYRVFGWKIFTESEMQTQGMIISQCMLGKCALLMLVGLNWLWVMTNDKHILVVPNNGVVMHEPVSWAHIEEQT